MLQQPSRDIIRPPVSPSYLGNHTLEAASEPVQVAAFRAVNHPFVCPLVLPVLALLPGPRRDDERARTLCGSYDRLRLCENSYSLLIVSPLK